MRVIYYPLILISTTTSIEPSTIHHCTFTDHTVTAYLLPSVKAEPPPPLLTKGHQPYEVRSWIATGLFFTVLLNVGLLVGVAKQCKCLLRVWLAQAGVWVVLGVYLTILHTFGTRVPLYGQGVLAFFGALLYVFFMVLVWIFHEVGDKLETVIRTHRLGSADDLIPEFDR